jgi:type II secretory pathway component HofQ
VFKAFSKLVDLSVKNLSTCSITLFIQYMNANLACKLTAQYDTGQRQNVSRPLALAVVEKPAYILCRHTLLPNMIVTSSL